MVVFFTLTVGIQYGSNSLTDYLDLDRFGTTYKFQNPGEKKVGDGEDLQGLIRTPAPQSYWAQS